MNAVLTPPKETPLLLKGHLVRAILDGSKTQTRRVCKPAEAEGLSYVIGIQDPRDLGQRPLEVPGSGWFGDEEGDVQFQCPYGKPGDRLWVRETFCLDDNGHNEWPMFRADGAALPTRPATRKPARWVPSIHMPRWASRLLLEITDLRVERLQDISEADIIAEGTPMTLPDGTPFRCTTPRQRFAELWDATGSSWSRNPWVWVISFKRVNA